MNGMRQWIRCVVAPHSASSGGGREGDEVAWPLGNEKLANLCLQNQIGPTREFDCNSWVQPVEGVPTHTVFITE